MKSVLEQLLNPSVNIKDPWLRLVGSYIHLSDITSTLCISHISGLVAGNDLSEKLILLKHTFANILAGTHDLINITLYGSGEPVRLCYMETTFPTN